MEEGSAMTALAKAKRAGPLPHLANALGPRDRNWIEKYGGTPAALEWAESLQPLIRELEAELAAAEAHASHLAQRKISLPLAEARVESAIESLRQLQELVKALRSKGTEYAERLTTDAYEVYCHRIQSRWKGETQ
jgi:hypothetical protein